MKNNSIRFHTQTGFTVLELLIALSLALIIIAGVSLSVTQAIKNNRLLSAQAEIQNSTHILHNRLAAIFTNALSSPCGSIESMLAAGRLKRAYTLSGNTEVIQQMDDILMPLSANVASATNAASAANAARITSGVSESVIRKSDFPLFLVGIAGHPHEPRISDGTADGLPLSQRLKNIVDGSEYFVIMGLTDRILLMGDTSLSRIDMRGVRGGSSVGASIHTSTIAHPARGERNVPWIITDCREATLFASSSSESVKTHAIPVDDDLLFGNTGYLAHEAVLSPVVVNAYYLSQGEQESQPSLSRFNLTSGQISTTPIMGGVRDIHFAWGLGEPDKGMVQGYFDTEKLLDHMNHMNQIATEPDTSAQAFIREHVISVRVQAVVESYNDDNHYRVHHLSTDTMGHTTGNATGNTDSNISTTMQRTYSIRNHLSGQR